MPGIIGRFKVLNTLGTGASCKVKLGMDTDSGDYVAIKIMNDSTSPSIISLLKDEIQAMSKLSHPNVIKQLDHGSGTYKKNSGKEKEVIYIVLELAQNGTLYDFVSADDNAFDMGMARYYFKQLLDGLNHCYLQGITHRDLKPENLMISYDSDLKIADFGYAGPANGRDGKGYLKTKCGTAHYMAPEIWEMEPYDGQAVDVFSCGVILFIMVTGTHPFSTAEAKDPYYKCIMKNKSHIFWKAHSKSKPVDFFSDEFKDLINACFSTDPYDRPSINELASLPWIKEQTPTKQEIQAVLEERQSNIKKAMETERQQRKLDKINQIQNQFGQAHRGETQTLEQFIQPSKEMDIYQQIGKDNTSQFFSTFPPDMIEDALRSTLTLLEIEPKEYDKQYKMKFTYENIPMTFVIQKINEETSCIQFLNRGEDFYQFKLKAKQLMNSELIQKMDDGIELN